MITCSCGKQNKDTAKFCVKCGLQLSNNHINSNNNDFCTSCGKSIKSEVKFCPYCGAGVARVQNVIEVQSNNVQNELNYSSEIDKAAKPNRKKLIIAGAVAVVFLAVIGGWIAYEQPWNQGSYSVQDYSDTYDDEYDEYDEDSYSDSGDDSSLGGKILYGDIAIPTYEESFELQASDNDRIKAKVIRESVNSDYNSKVAKSIEDWDSNHKNTLISEVDNYLGDGSSYEDSTPIESDDDGGVYISVEENYLYDGDFNGYSIRADDTITGIVLHAYEDYGGVHPSYRDFAANFDGKSGEKLTLQDIATNWEDLAIYICDTVVYETSINDDIYWGFDDNELWNCTSDIICSDETDGFNNWFLSDNGLVVFFNPYEMFDYATGTVCFEMSYDDLADYIDSKYLL